MYWPIGAPRIYSSNRKKRGSVQQRAGDLQENDSSKDASKTILGLRVSRSGHLFATITQTALTVWQTNVSESGSELIDSD